MRVFLLAALLSAASVAWGQAYPKGPITLVIPVAPGDASDIAGRLMADELARKAGSAK